jgi:hemerythrin-like domain-containing protein
MQADLANPLTTHNAAKPRPLHSALAWFVNDHALLEPALEALSHCVATQTLPSQALLQHLNDHMAEHFGLEETVLFPAVPFTPSVMLLLAEHDTLWQAWHAMAQACHSHQPNWPDTVNAYLHLMRHHMHEEDACLFPSCQRDMPIEHLLHLHRKLEHAQLRKNWVERAPWQRHYLQPNGTVSATPFNRIVG